MGALIVVISAMLTGHALQAFLDRRVPSAPRLPFGAGAALGALAGCAQVAAWVWW